MTYTITETVEGAAERTRVAVVLARGLGTRMRASSPAGSGLTSQQATAAASGYKALMPIGEHRLMAPLHEAAHLFDAVLYGHVVSTRSQDRQMRELAAQVVTITLPAGRPLAGATAAGPGAPA